MGLPDPTIRVGRHRPISCCCRRAIRSRRSACARRASPWCAAAACWPKRLRATPGCPWRGGPSRSTPPATRLRPTAEPRPGTVPDRGAVPSPRPGQDGTGWIPVAATIALQGAAKARTRHDPVLRARPLSRARGRDRGGCAAQHARSRPPRRALGLSPLLAGRAPQHARHRQRRDGGADRPCRGGDHDDPRRRGRHHAARTTRRW